MKKTLALLLCLALVTLSLFSCGGAPRIQKETWIFAVAVVDNNITHVSPAHTDAAPKGTPVIECTLTAKGGAITITDETNEKTYTGTYSDREKINPSAADYRITFGRKKGKAVTSRGLNISGTKETRTLTLYIDGYEILFAAAE